MYVYTYAYMCNVYDLHVWSECVSYVICMYEACVYLCVFVHLCMRRSIHTGICITPSSPQHIHTYIHTHKQTASNPWNTSPTCHGVLGLRICTHTYIHTYIHTECDRILGILHSQVMVFWDYESAHGHECSSVERQRHFLYGHQVKVVG